MALDINLFEFASGPNYAALATTSTSGQPRNPVMWIDADEDSLYFNTVPGRQKVLDIERDPRVTIATNDNNNPGRYVEARGRVVAMTGGADAVTHVHALSQKYFGRDYHELSSERLICKVAVDHVYSNLSIATSSASYAGSSASYAGSPANGDAR